MKNLDENKYSLINEYTEELIHKLYEYFDYVSEVQLVEDPIISGDDTYYFDIDVDFNEDLIPNNLDFILNINNVLKELNYEFNLKNVIIEIEESESIYFDINRYNIYLRNFK